VISLDRREINVRYSIQNLKLRWEIKIGKWNMENMYSERGEFL